MARGPTPRICAGLYQYRHLFLADVDNATLYGKFFFLIAVFDNDRSRLHRRDERHVVGQDGHLPRRAWERDGIRLALPNNFIHTGDCQLHMYDVLPATMRSLFKQDDAVNEKLEFIISDPLAHVRLDVRNVRFYNLDILLHSTDHLGMQVKFL